MQKHPSCAKLCQYADERGVWPEHSCAPECMWLKHGVNLDEPAGDADKRAADNVRRANRDIEQNIDMNKGGF